MNCTRQDLSSFDLCATHFAPSPGRASPCVLRTLPHRFFLRKILPPVCCATSGLMNPFAPGLRSTQGEAHKGDGAQKGNTGVKIFQGKI